MVCNANDNVNRIEISVISKKANAVNPEEKIYEYEEAIDLTGKTESLAISVSKGHKNKF